MTANLKATKQGGELHAANVTRQLSLPKTTGQSLLSLAFNLGGIFAGFIVASSLGLFSHEPWVIALYPGILSMRGVIGGLFSGRLSTGLHLGTINTSLFGEEAKNLHLLWASVAVLTFESATMLGFATLLLGIISWGINIVDCFTILSTILATMGLSLLLITPVTLVVAFSSFKKGLDPDIIVYPVIATIADILVTLSYTFVLALFFLMEVVAFVLAICVGFTIIVLFISYRNRRRALFIKTLKEATATMIIVAFIVTITGSVLSKISEVLVQTMQTTLARIYIIYTALISTMGDLGAIIGATATTKLALGTIDSSFKAIRNHRNQITGTWIASLIIYLILAIISSLLTIPVSILETIRFINSLLITNIFAAFFMIWIAFSVAILTFHKGLDPDNFVIPIESALADALTTIFLLFTLSLLG